MFRTKWGKYDELVEIMGNDWKVVASCLILMFEKGTSSLNSVAQVRFGQRNMQERVNMTNLAPYPMAIIYYGLEWEDMRN